MADCGTCLFWIPRKDESSIWVCGSRFSHMYDEICYERDPACHFWEDWYENARKNLENK